MPWPHLLTCPRMTQSQMLEFTCALPGQQEVTLSHPLAKVGGLRDLRTSCRRLWSQRMVTRDRMTPSARQEEQMTLVMTTTMKKVRTDMAAVDQAGALEEARHQILETATLTIGEGQVQADGQSGTMATACIMLQVQTCTTTFT